MSVEDLKSQGGSIHQEVESLLSQLAEIQNSLQPGNIEFVIEGDLPENRIISSIETLLSRLQTTAVELRSASDSKMDQTRANQFLSNHGYLQKEFVRLKDSIRTTRNKNDLFGGRNGASNEEFNALLIRENESLDNSLNITSNILDQGQEIKSSFGRQKSLMEDTGAKVVTFAETLPGINVLLSRIEKRKRLNAVVMAIAIAISIILLIIFCF